MTDYCGNCRFYEVQNVVQGQGICRRYPPVVVINTWLTQEPNMLTADRLAQVPKNATISAVQSLNGNFAPTQKDMWCGEYQPETANIAEKEKN